MATTASDVADELAVCATMYRFAAGIDTRDWSLYRSVFTDDIDVDYSSYRPGSVARMPADAWVDRARVLFTGLDGSQHCIMNPRVTLRGDEADFIGYVQAEHFLTNGFGDNSYTLGGYYEDRLVRVDGEWLITAKKLTVLWNRGNRDVLVRGADLGRERLADGATA